MWVVWTTHQQPQYQQRIIFRCETAITTDVTTFDNKSHRNMSLEIIVRKFN